MAWKIVGASAGGLSLRLLTFQLLLQLSKNGERRRVLYFYDQACSRAYYFDRGPRRRLEIFAYRLLLLCPPGLLALGYRLAKGKTLDLQQLRDQYHRL